MSISTQIDRILTKIHESYEVLKTKGATIPENKNSSNLPDSILSISPTYTISEGTLSVIDDSSITHLNSSAFSYQSNLTYVNLPNCQEIYAYSVFEYCTNLTSVTLNSLTKLTGKSIFRGCSNLQEFIAPNLQYLGYRNSDYYMEMNFEGCTNLTSIQLPELLELYHGGLSGTGVTSLYLPKLQRVYGRNPLQINAIRIEVPSLVNITGSDIFYSTGPLETLILGKQVSVRLSSGSVENFLPPQTIIYVNTSDLSWYQSNAFWSYFYNLDRIKSIDDLPSE